MLHTVPPVWWKRLIKMSTQSLKNGITKKHVCLYISNRSGYFVQNDFATSCLTSTLLLLSQVPTRSSSTSAVATNSGMFGIPVDAVMKCFRECSTAGQTKELINNTNHKHDKKCVCLHPFSMNTRSSSPLRNMKSVWMQEEMVKTGFSHESVRKQEVFASQKKPVLLPFLLVEKGTTPTNQTNCQPNWLDPTLCVGFSFIGASVMSGNKRDVYVILKQSCLWAVNFHCNSHRLNLVSLSTLAYSFDTVSNIHSFMGGSSRHAGYLIPYYLM